MNATQNQVRLKKLTLSDRVLTLDFSEKIDSTEIANDFIEFCRKYEDGNNDFHLRQRGNEIIILHEDIEYQVRRNLNPPLAYIHAEGNKVYIDINVKTEDVSAQYFPLLYELEMGFRQHLLYTYIKNYMGRLESEGFKFKRL